MRRGRMRRSISSKSIESTDSLDSERSTKSMMDLSTHLRNDESSRLKVQIDSLKEQLMSAHLEIETLTLENGSLKNQLSEEQMKSDRFKKLYITSINTSKSSKYRSTDISFLSGRKLDLDIDCETPKMCISSSTINNSQRKARNTAIEPTKSENYPHHIIVNSSPNSSLPRPQKAPADNQNTGIGKILLLSDEQGKGIIRGLLKKKEENRFIINNSLEISGIRKPGARTEEVLSSCKNLSEKLTKNDSVIIMSGSNDSNPTKLLTEMGTAIKLLKNCNVFIVNVRYNVFLNERKLNYHLQLLTQNYANCNFIEATNYNGMISELLIKINSAQYYTKYLSYNNNKPLIKVSKATKYLEEKLKPMSSPDTIIKRPHKGTIPFYFTKVVKTQQSLVSEKHKTVVEKQLFRK